MISDVHAARGPQDQLNIDDRRRSAMPDHGGSGPIGQLAQLEGLYVARADLRTRCGPSQRYFLARHHTPRNDYRAPPVPRQHVGRTCGVPFATVHRRSRVPIFRANSRASSSNASPRIPPTASNPRGCWRRDCKRLGCSNQARLSKRRAESTRRLMTDSGLPWRRSNLRAPTLSSPRSRASRTFTCLRKPHPPGRRAM